MDPVREAEAIARATGSIGARVIHERVNLDGTREVLSEGVWMRKEDS
jgi:hypothetical protein